MQNYFREYIQELHKHRLHSCQMQIFWNFSVLKFEMNKDYLSEKCEWQPDNLQQNIHNRAEMVISRNSRKMVVLLIRPIDLGKAMSHSVS